MQTTFEKLGGTYPQVGDYLLPDIEVPESSQIGRRLGPAEIAVFSHQ